MYVNKGHLRTKDTCFDLVCIINLRKKRKIFRRATNTMISRPGVTSMTSIIVVILFSEGCMKDNFHGSIRVLYLEVLV